MKESTNQRLILIFGIIAIVFFFAGLALQASHGQNKPESKVETCTVDDANKDGTKAIHCETFDFILNAWPKTWELYKSKGEHVRVKVDGDRVIPIAPPCEERIARIKLQHADGSLARLPESAIIPADCLPIGEGESKR